jgi:hypothetical protein
VLVRFSSSMRSLITSAREQRAALSELVLWIRPQVWPPLADHVRRRVRALALFAFAAQVIFILGWILAGALERGYSPVRSFISELGRRGAANAWIFDLSVVVWGLGFIALGIASASALRGQRWGKALPSLCVLAGVFAVLDAPLRLDCAATVEHLCRAREAAGALSWRHYGHEWSSLGIEVALVLTPFALAVSAWPSRLARLVLGAGVAVLLARATTYLLSGGFNGHNGLEQRLWLLVVHVWVAICACALLAEAHAGAARSALG